MQKQPSPFLTIIKPWGFQKNPMCQPGNMDLDKGEKVIFLNQYGGDWWEISHPVKGQCCIHKSCFDVFVSAAYWGYPESEDARPGLL